jgi:hypothetical protein
LTSCNFSLLVFSANANTYFVMIMMRMHHQIIEFIIYVSFCL